MGCLIAVYNFLMTTSSSNKKVWIISGIVVLAVGAGVGVYFLRQGTGAATATNEPNAPVAAAASDSSWPSPRSAVILNDVTLREGTNTDAKVIDTLKTCLTVQATGMRLETVNGAQTPWYQVKASDKTGWVPNDSIGFYGDQLIALKAVDANGTFGDSTSTEPGAQVVQADGAQEQWWVTVDEPGKQERANTKEFVTQCLQSNDDLIRANAQKFLSRLPASDAPADTTAPAAPEDATAQ